MKEETRKLLIKAERAIRAAEALRLRGDADFAVGRAYYAMFYLAEALLNQCDLHFRKHSGVHAAFGEHFAKPGLLDQKFHRWLLDAFDRRILGDYEVEGVVTEEDAVAVIGQAREFLAAVRQLLDTVQKESG
jgi:uncharacterized protein (UPF0332 family)